MTGSQVIEEMRKKGCRITKQRKLIVDIIMNNEFTSCKEIYYRVIKEDPTIGMATVYRMINQLEEMNVIRRIERIEVVR
ncbi:MAG: Fe2+/Zn2+ uptake regulation protein [Lachnospiraceae bacterium]|nr:Fe2+/Zn2+ uptake regulation protein [Lachnospiraceae bacterium]MBQ6318648.1 transcriptional repressor [Lachnospiraceae bacterium]MBR1450093.1 transcriptional repressor [Lachnospiraceae bacterium]